ncbi:MAG TPA: DUF222 domain-containing protein, partial [Actinomycetales bacterium]|nr:DUF222 domain-containing protein [Actinomycetales bacterium]
LSDAVDLAAHLPQTLTQLEQGKLTVAGVRAVLDETTVLDPGDRGKVEDVIYCDRPGRQPHSKNPRNVRNRCRRAVLGIDPDAAHKREKAAHRSRAVRHRPDTDGMSTLTITAALPDAAAAFEHLDTHARALAREHGEIRGIEAIRSDLAIGALTGRVFLGNPETLASPASIAGVLPAVAPTPTPAWPPTPPPAPAQAPTDRAGRGGRGTSAPRSSSPAPTPPSSGWTTAPDTSPATDPSPPTPCAPWSPGPGSSTPSPPTPPPAPSPPSPATWSPRTPMAG